MKEFIGGEENGGKHTFNMMIYILLFLYLCAGRKIRYAAVRMTLRVVFSTHLLLKKRKQ